MFDGIGLNIGGFLDQDGDICSLLFSVCLDKNPVQCIKIRCGFFLLLNTPKLLLGKIVHEYGKVLFYW